MTQVYFIPEDAPTEWVKGGKISEDKIREWFGGRNNLDSYHATRDAHRIGGASCIESVKEITVEEYKARIVGSKV